MPLATGGTRILSRLFLRPPESFRYLEALQAGHQYGRWPAPVPHEYRKTYIVRAMSPVDPVLIHPNVKPHMNLNDMRISTRLALGFGILTLLIALMGASR